MTIKDAVESVIENAIENASEMEANSHLLSVQILLPERMDERLEERTEEMPGASWPSWGGHVTLVPPFTARVSQDEILAILTEACADESQFTLCFGEPAVVKDVTRPGYYAVLLAVEEVHGAAAPSGEEDAPHLEEQGTADQASDDQSDGSEAFAITRLEALRTRLLAALEDVRTDLFPQLFEKAFRPHVTLALGLGEAEASKLVQGLRAEPIEGEFLVDVIWLVARVAGDASRFARHPVALARAVMQRSS